MMKQSSEFHIALRITWYICSSMGILILLLLPCMADLLSYLFPVCPSKLQGKSCWFCGGTRGLKAIIDGDWKASFRLNALSFLLIICIWMNTFIFLHHIYKRFLKP